MKSLTIKQMRQQLKEKINRMRTKLNRMSDLTRERTRAVVSMLGVAEDLFTKAMDRKARLSAIRWYYGQFKVCEHRFYRLLNGEIQCKVCGRWITPKDDVIHECPDCFRILCGDCAQWEDNGSYIVCSDCGKAHLKKRGAA